MKSDCRSEKVRKKKRSAVYRPIQFEVAVEGLFSSPCLALLQAHTFKEAVRNALMQVITNALLTF